MTRQRKLKKSIVESSAMVGKSLVLEEYLSSAPFSVNAMFAFKIADIHMSLPTSLVNNSRHLQTALSY